MPRAAFSQMRGDDLFLAGLERPVEIVGEDHVIGDEFAIAEGLAELGRQIDQHEPGAELVGGPLDLGEAVHRRGIDAGDEAEVEQQEAGLGALGEESLHLLVEPVGRAEEDIALQAHALDLVAVGGEDGELFRSSIERGAIFGPVEAELDGVHPARADGEGGAADDDADQDAGDEADLENEDAIASSEAYSSSEIRCAELISHS